MPRQLLGLCCSGFTLTVFDSCKIMSPTPFRMLCSISLGHSMSASLSTLLFFFAPRSIYSYVPSYSSAFVLSALFILWINASILIQQRRLEPAPWRAGDVISVVFTVLMAVHRMLSPFNVRFRTGSGRKRKKNPVLRYDCVPMASHLRVMVFLLLFLAPGKNTMK